MKLQVKLILSVLLFFMVKGVNAQSFGLKAGLNLATIFQETHPAGYDFEYTMNPGFKVGAFIEVPLIRILSVESGLMLATKGTRFLEENSHLDETHNYKTILNLYYFDIPVKAKTTFDIGGMKIYGAFGPYAGVGLSGKLNHSYTGNGETEISIEDVRFGFDENEDDLRRLDFGLAAGAGVQLNLLQLGLEYSLGFANIAANREDGHNIKNRVLGISLSYIFSLN